MPKDTVNMPKHRCSFCGKSQDQVRRIIAGPGAYICNECIALCQEIIADDLDVMASAPDMKEIPTPSEMKEVLDEYVIGQEQAKRTLCVAVYNHYKRIAAPIKKIFKLLLNAVCGLVLLFIANFIGGFFNFAIPVNLLTCIIAGAFGIPGVIFLGVVVLFMG